MRIYSKVIFFQLLLLLFVMTVIGSIKSYSTSTRLNNDLTTKGQRIMKRFPNSLVMPIWNLDYDEVLNLIDLELLDSDISGIIITFENEKLGKYINDSNEIVDFTEDVYEVIEDRSFIKLVEDIYKDNNELGSVSLYFNDKRIVKENRRQVIQIVLELVLQMILIGLSVFFILLSKLNKPLKMVQQRVEEISKGGGDLTCSLEIISNDEIGSLSKSFNTFIEKLKSIIINIKSSASSNNKISGDLNNASAKAASASIQITKNSETITNQIKLLNDNVNETTSGVYEISSNISHFKQQINDQVSVVEESSASIQEMIASLDNVSKITSKKLESTKRLVDTTKTGEGILSETNDQFKIGISDKIESIKNMVDIISNISERTNLLAMNAAIEAAHAGDAGKGFAVVADEIRKMAEEAANSSTNISSVIKTIIDSIHDTDTNMKNTSEAFKSIYTEVAEIDIALNEIATNTIELSSGGHEILKAVSLLNDTTSNISSGINEIEAGSEDITHSMLQVKDISNEVFSGIDEISRGIVEVSTSFQEVAQLADDLDQESNKLNNEVDKFIV